MTAALLLALALAAIPEPVAGPADRMAVLILPEEGTEASLADNLTEIAIARIAERQQVQLAGTMEFRRRLGLEGPRHALGCLEDIACLGRIGVGLGVQRIVAGSVRQDQARYLVHLTLTDIESGRVDRRFFRHVQTGLDGLIKTVQEGSDDLFRPREEPGRLRIESDPPRARVTIDDLFAGTTPLLSGALLPGPHVVRVEKDNRLPWQQDVIVKPASELEIKLSPENLPGRRRWPSYAAGSGLVAATAAVGTGAVLGALSQMESSTTNRQAAQEDLYRRRDLATRANALLISGAVVGVVSLVVLYVYRRDVFAD